MHTSASDSNQDIQELDLTISNVYKRICEAWMALQANKSSKLHAATQETERRVEYGRWMSSVGLKRSGTSENYHSIVQLKCSEQVVHNVQFGHFCLWERFYI